MSVFHFFLKMKGHNEEVMNISLADWLIPGLIKLYLLWDKLFKADPTCIVEAFRQNKGNANQIWISNPTSTY